MGDVRKWLRRGLWTLVILTASDLVAAVCAIPLLSDRGTGDWLLLLGLLLLVLLEFGRAHV